MVFDTICQILLYACVYTRLCGVEGVYVCVCGVWVMWYVCGVWHVSVMCRSEWCVWCVCV